MGAEGVKKQKRKKVETSQHPQHVVAMNKPTL
jgi:hypothetical protein